MSRSQSHNRVGLLREFEGFMERIDGVPSGRACLLRTLCEVGETPVHSTDSVGQFLGTLATGHGSSDYARAHRQGFSRTGCAEYHEECPTSLYQASNIQAPYISLSSKRDNFKFLHFQYTEGPYDDLNDISQFPYEFIH